ncbi:MAG: hypothetical protein KJN76_08100 [Eudoraea sp.]|nr:hypothetical protein [Eudoraea sp.]
MKKVIMSLILLMSISTVVFGCRDTKTSSEKVEDHIEEVGEDLEEGAEEIEDEIDDATDDSE